MKHFVMATLALLTLTSCAAGSAVSAASAWSLHAAEADALSAEAERGLTDRIIAEIVRTD